MLMKPHDDDDDDVIMMMMMGMLIGANDGTQRGQFSCVNIVNIFQTHGLI